MQTLVKGEYFFLLNFFDPYYFTQKFKVERNSKLNNKLIKGCVNFEKQLNWLRSDRVMIEFDALLTIFEDSHVIAKSKFQYDANNCSNQVDVLKHKLDAKRSVKITTQI